MMQHAGIWMPDAVPGLKPSVMAKDIAPDGTYRADRYRRAVGHCREFRTAVDVGAHVGTWARLMAQEFEAVVAFEPLPAHQLCFGMNVAAFNVELHICALGERDGTTMLQGGPAMSVRVGEDGFLSVPIRRLDMFDLQTVDFLKVDVEGSELAVLRGATALLERWRPVVLVEQHAGCTPGYGFGEREAIEFLECLGAKHLWQDGVDHCLAWEVS